jgi:hypothetical protein
MQFLTRILSSQLLFLLQLRKSNQKAARQTMFFIQLSGEHKCEGRSKAQASATPILILGGSATSVSGFKVSAKNTYALLPFFDTLTYKLRLNFSGLFWSDTELIIQGLNYEYENFI